jgi:hypothetical protein
VKLKILGAGNTLLRHPLVHSSFLLQSEKSHTVFGCGPSVPAKLESIDIPLDSIDIWAPLSTRYDQMGGLVEVALQVLSGKIKKPYLAGPEYLLRKLQLPKPLLSAFNVTYTRTIHVNEEHVEEHIDFVPNHLGSCDSYGLFFKSAEIFISGETELNEEWLHHYGSGSQVILHSCRLSEAAITDYAQAPTLSDLQKLPLYLQKKTWLYHYTNAYLSVEDPLPMIFLPQGQCIYDSNRKLKHLEKERFIRENSARQLGNLKNAT